MTSGDEPQLSQPNRDDDAQGDLSPMMSGRGTRIIVSARGAYQAGNVRALVEQMDADQQYRYHAAAARYALWCVDRVSPFDSESAHRIIALARQWLENAETSHGDTMLQMLLEAGFGTLYPLGDGEDYFDGTGPLAFMLYHTTLLIREADPREVMLHTQGVAANASSVALERIGELSHMSASPQTLSAIRAAERWLLEAAYAIVTNHPIPPLGDPQ